MGQRTRIAVGSLLGALSLHVVMVACGSSPPSTPGDSGVLADVRDAVVDVIQDIVDAETPDAHAGGDGGVPPADGGAPSCPCVPARPEYSFSGGGVGRGGAVSAPEVDFSSTSAEAVLSRADDGSLLVTVQTGTLYRTADGASVTAYCEVYARPDGSLLSRADGDGGMYDTQCSIVSYRNGDISGSSSPSRPLRLSGGRVVTLTQDRAEVVLPSITIPVLRAVGGMQTPAGDVVIAPLAVRGYVPGGTWLTPPRAYRP